MSDHRQQALAFTLEAQKSLEVAAETKDDAVWRDQAKIEALLAQAEALVYVGDQIARRGERRADPGVHLPLLVRADDGTWTCPRCQASQDD